MPTRYTVDGNDDSAAASRDPITSVCQCAIGAYACSMQNMSKLFTKGAINTLHAAAPGKPALKTGVYS